MPDLFEKPPTFNLWTEPWIDLERPDGSIERQGIAGVLFRAREYHGLALSSPLEMAAIHRLLTAILQDALHPAEMADLRALLASGCFPEEPLLEFGRQYADRFDLFSPYQPFLQTADLPLLPDKKTPVKTVAYLAYDFPSGTGVVHYRHSLEDDQAFCPACCARGLACIPAFATSGGAGIKPSINGVPPIYILPCGKNLFESLALSLVLPDYQPAARDHDQDLAFWKHVPTIGKSQEVNVVGYLHSLTFPARRVRLHPKQEASTCTRCGHPTNILVPTMVFEMGEAYGKTVTWLDPFAAYTQEGENPPKPVRPVPGKAAWREFGSLFLQHPPEQDGKRRRAIRPRLVDQLDGLEYALGSEAQSLAAFRCIGLRTDMKAKIFEWIDTGFEVPGGLLHSLEAGLDVEDALRYAGSCEGIMLGVLQNAVNRSKKNGNRHLHLKGLLKDAYWNGLSRPFRGFTLALGEAHQNDDRDQQREVRLVWMETVTRLASRVFAQVIEEVGDDGAALHLRYAAIDECNGKLFGSLKKEKSNGQ